MGKSLIIAGIILIIIGTFFTLGGKVSWLGRLPGDIVMQKNNFSFYFPLTTCMLISVIFSVILYLIIKR
ncbi:MAG: DUF2905 domain-containing protein [Candidatus Omnitrophota bacterium]